MDGAHPSDGILQMPLIPPSGTFKEKMTGDAQYVWWMGFNQVKGLPEQLLEGRFHLLLDWLFAYVMIDETKMPAFEREIYSAAYNNIKKAFVHQMPGTKLLLRILKMERLIDH